MNLPLLIKLHIAFYQEKVFRRNWCCETFQTMHLLFGTHIEPPGSQDATGFYSKLEFVLHYTQKDFEAICD